MKCKVTSSVSHAKPNKNEANMLRRSSRRATIERRVWAVPKKPSKPGTSAKGKCAPKSDKKGRKTQTQTQTKVQIKNVSKGHPQQNIKRVHSATEESGNSRRKIKKTEGTKDVGTDGSGTSEVPSEPVSKRGKKLSGDHSEKNLESDDGADFRSQKRWGYTESSLDGQSVDTTRNTRSEGKVNTSRRTEWCGGTSSESTRGNSLDALCYAVEKYGGRDVEETLLTDDVCLHKVVIEEVVTDYRISESNCDVKDLDVEHKVREDIGHKDEYRDAVDILDHFQSKTGECNKGNSEKLLMKKDESIDVVKVKSPVLEVKENSSDGASIESIFGEGVHEVKDTLVKDELNEGESYASAQDGLSNVKDLSCIEDRLQRQEKPCVVRDKLQEGRSSTVKDVKSEGKNLCSSIDELCEDHSCEDKLDESISRVKELAKDQCASVKVKLGKHGKEAKEKQSENTCNIDVNEEKKRIKDGTDSENTEEQESDSGVEDKTASNIPFKNEGMVVVPANTETAAGEDSEEDHVSLALALAQLVNSECGGEVEGAETVTIHSASSVDHLEDEAGVVTLGCKAEEVDRTESPCPAEEDDMEEEEEEEEEGELIIKEEDEDEVGDESEEEEFITELKQKNKEDDIREETESKEPLPMTVPEKVTDQLDCLVEMGGEEEDKNARSRSGSPPPQPPPQKSRKQLPPLIKISSRPPDFKALDLVWAKLDGYPWWPGLVCDSPSEKTFMRKGLIHVQFFDNPPTRGWVREAFLKPYCPPGENGIPTYKDPKWIRAMGEADGAKELPVEDRNLLIVEMVPSDEEDEAMETDEDDSDKSKENVDANISGRKGSKTKSKESDGEPKKKRRRIILHSDSESGDDYKPENDDESEEGSASSGVDENDVSEPESESEIDSPVKAPSNKRKRPAPGGRNLNSSLASSPSVSKTPSSTPKISQGTKSKLSLFAAKETPAKAEDTTENYDYMNYPWLKPEGIRDRERRRPDHPDYNPRTLYVPEDFLNQQTPGLRQWWELKSRHYDTVLFFKMGKFYELFHMDAMIGVQELGLLMMKGEKAHSGFPEIAYGRYSATLIEKGYKVARIEQTETPEMMEKRCKNMGRPTKFDRVVKREVCQISTRGTRVYSVLDGEASESSTNYLMAISEKTKAGAGDVREFGVAFIDTSIGTFHIGQFPDDRHDSRLSTLMAHYPPAQILYERGRLSQKTQKLVTMSVPANLREALVPEKEFWTASKTLTFLADGTYFKDEEGGSLQWPKEIENMLDESDTLGKTPSPEWELGLSALGALVWYLMDCRLEEQLLTRKRFETYSPLDEAVSTKQGKKDSVPAFISGRHHMVLDGTTLRNLEVFENNSGGFEGTLIDRLDRCSTPFGKRLLRSWLCAPLCSPSSINSRLDAIEDLRNNPEVLEEITPQLKGLPDLERILSKIHSQGLKRSKNHPDSRAIFFEDEKYNKRKVEDFLAALNGFKATIQIMKTFKGIASSLQSDLLKKCVSSTKDGGKFPVLKEALDFFENAFDHHEAKREGKIIPSKGVDKEFDEAAEQIQETKASLAEYLKQQCKYFGAKVVYWGNDKKRYQLEVPDHACKKAGNEYELVSQKKGYKRFWTPKTKDLLADMISGEEHHRTALKDIARRIFEQFDNHHEKWEAVVQCISVLDVLISLTRYSQEINSVRPAISIPSEELQPFIEIRDGLHPCVVTTFSGDEFIPNDVVLGGSSEDAHSPLVLVTGPNMGGKSTLMRQTALICILAQLGSFVPASSCQLTPVDRVFTRLGASDRIMMGESTFFVELAETSSIIQHSTNHSLVLVDELGRGTATYDGTAIASAVVEALVKLKCRTLFSTHYHSLVDDFADVKNVSLGHMACMVEGENEEDPSQETITFLYKFTGGACPKSYGFNAARLADLPEEVIRRGSQKARELEKNNMKKRTFTEVFRGKSIGKVNNLKHSLKKIIDIAA